MGACVSHTVLRIQIAALHSRNVGDASSVLGRVDEAEIIGARGTLLEVCCEDVRL
jgi:hypothetical protein